MIFFYVFITFYYIKNDKYYIIKSTNAKWPNFLDMLTFFFIKNRLIRIIIINISELPYPVMLADTSHGIFNWCLYKMGLDNTCKRTQYPILCLGSPTD